MRWNPCLSVMVLAFAASSALAQPPTPSGPEFVITTGIGVVSEDYPAVATDAAGSFVVVWGKGVGAAIKGRRFASSGTPLGDVFELTGSVCPTFYCIPAVAAAANGDFVVVWGANSGVGDDDSYQSVQGQRFSSAGTELGARFQVNTYTTGKQSYPAVVVDSERVFTVVWQSAGSTGTDTSADSIQLRRFDLDGGALGPEFQVNSYTTLGQTTPDVAIGPTDEFLVVWNSDGSAETDVGGTSIQGRLFSSSGTPLMDQFQVNSFTPSNQQLPDVAPILERGFAIVWENVAASPGDDDGNRSIVGRFADATGLPLGADFQVNTFTGGNQRLPAVAVSSSGGVIALWNDAGAVRGQMLRSDASKEGSEFVVSDLGSMSDLVFQGGGLVAVWENVGEDLTSDIFGQRFEDPFVFSDGFETGDTSAWSAAVP